MNDKTPQYEQKENQRTHVNGPRRERLVTPVSVDLRQIRTDLRIGSLRRMLVLGEQSTGSSLTVGNKQGKRLHLAITPFSNIILIQSAARIFLGIVLRCQLGMSTSHGFLRILIGMIQIRGIRSDSQ